MLRLCTGYGSKDLRSEEGKVIVRVGYWSSIKDLGFNFFFNSTPSLINFETLTAGIVKKLFEIARTKKKKHNKFLMLAKSKLNRNKTLISQTLIGLEIIHQEFKTIVKEKERSM